MRAHPLERRGLAREVEEVGRRQVRRRRRSRDRGPTIFTSASGSGYGSGRSSTARMTLNIAVLAPSPSASVTTAISVNAGRRASARSASAQILEQHAGLDGRPATAWLSADADAAELFGPSRHGYAQLIRHLTRTPPPMPVSRSAPTDASPSTRSLPRPRRGRPDLPGVSPCMPRATQTVFGEGPARAATRAGRRTARRRRRSRGHGRSSDQRGPCSTALLQKAGLDRARAST